MSHTLLRIENLTKQYVQGNRRIDALRGVSLDIYQGEVLGLLGVNGAGKSTLASIITTIHPPTSGSVLYEGISIYDDLVGYRSKLGYCPQHHNLDNDLTLEQNLRFAGRYHGMSEQAINERIKELAEQFELTKYLQFTGHALSGGYKQRFMIARCLMHRPSIVLLDEPTVGLDPHIRRQLWDIITDLKKSGVTVVLTTHYMDEAEQLSDRICIMDKGLIQLIGTPQELKDNLKKTNLEDIFLALVQACKETL